MKSMYLSEWDSFIRYYEITGDGLPVIYLAGLSFSIIGSMLSVAIKLALMRPDLVANLIVGEGNVTSGGGAATQKISSYEKDQYVTEIFPRLRQERFEAAVKGDSFCNRLNGLWVTVDPADLHGNSRALVAIDDSLKDQFIQLSMPRTFIYGEKSLPEKAGGVGPDAPDPEELKANGIKVGIVPNAGHGQMFDNLDGFVDVLLQASA